MCVCGGKRDGKKKKVREKEGGGWKRVSGHRGLWLVTHLLCGGLGVSPHPPLSPPPLVLCLVLSFSCPLPFPPCVCECVRVEGLGGWWIVSESPPTSPHHATTTIPRCPCCPSLSSCPFSLPFCPFLFLFLFLLLLLKKEKEREVEACGCTHHHCALWLVPRFSGVSQSVSWW